jgi:Restriction endonuclease
VVAGTQRLLQAPLPAQKPQMARIRSYNRVMQDWLAFERLAQQIQSDLAPDAQVTHNERLIGKSGVEHQCDLVLRSKIGQLDFICVIECKDKRSKVNLETVRAFTSRLQDVSASQGIIVAAKGFTRDALRYAKAHGVLAYTLFDAQSLKWNKQALVPLVLGFVMLGRGYAEFLNPPDGKVLHLKATEPFDWEALPLWDSLRREWVPLKVYLEHRWDEYAAVNAVSKMPVTATDVSQRYSIYVDQKARPVTIRYTLTPQFKWCYNRLPLLSGRGFVDQVSGTVLLPNFRTLIETHKAYETWPHVDEADKLPFAPIENLRLKVTFFYHNAPSHTFGPGPVAIEVGRRSRGGA